MTVVFKEIKSKWWRDGIRVSEGLYLLPVQFKNANEPLTMSATSPVASRATVAPAIKTIIKYVTVVIKMANKVPFGMDFWGSYDIKDNNKCKYLKRGRTNLL